MVVCQDQNQEKLIDAFYVFQTYCNEVLTGLSNIDRQQLIPVSEQIQSLIHQVVKIYLLSISH